MITTESRITCNGRADSALTCSAPVGPDFATNGELTAANPFVVYGERPQLLKSGKTQVENARASEQSERALKNVYIFT